jgi:probable phosphoglycerate mutase
MTTQIILIRHGETEWNSARRIQGQIDIPLSAIGEAQAVRLAERLEQGPPIDCIYSSDLARARQTAEPAAARLGLPVNTLQGLRERAYGSFEGLTGDEVRLRYPADYARWQARDPSFRPGTGESQQVFYERCTAQLATLVSRHPGQRVVCVTHGGVLNCAYHYVTRLPLTAKRDWSLLNASLNVIDCDAGVMRIAAWADVAHLTDAADDASVVAQPDK